MKPWLFIAVGVALSGCGFREEGLTVSLHTEVAPITSSSAHLDRATVTLEAAELVVCETTAWWQYLSPISSAWAHGGESHGTSPLRLEIDASVALLTPGTQNVATLRPPPGSYCALRITFGPQPSDASSQSMTLEMTGTFQNQPLQITAVNERSRTLTLPAPLELDTSQPSAELTLHLSPDTLLAGVPYAPSDTPPLDRLLSGLTLTASR